MALDRRQGFSESPLLATELDEEYYGLWETIYLRWKSHRDNPQMVSMTPLEAQSISESLLSWRSIMSKLEDSTPSIKAMRAFFQGLSPDKYPDTGKRVTPWNFLDVKPTYSSYNHPPHNTGYIKISLFTFSARLSFAVSRSISMIRFSILSTLCIALHLLATIATSVPNLASPKPSSIAARSDNAPDNLQHPEPDLGLPIYFIQTMDNDQLTQLSKDLLTAFLFDSKDQFRAQVISPHLARLLDGIYFARLELGNSPDKQDPKMSLKPATAQKIFDSLMDCRAAANMLQNLMQSESAMHNFFITGLLHFSSPALLKAKRLALTLIMHLPLFPPFLYLLLHLLTVTSTSSATALLPRADIPPPKLPIYFIRSMDLIQLQQLRKDLAAAVALDMRFASSRPLWDPDFMDEVANVFLCIIAAENELTAEGRQVGADLSVETASSISAALLKLQGLVGGLQSNALRFDAMQRFYERLKQSWYPKGMDPDMPGKT
ncbi:MAG: hypothetical protein M1829_001611 [Trizodia sp. TS-e1964]|nr:MAG: hypothetical protein M1829_001611 [Trizodia sp. TS-e1964]